MGDLVLGGDGGFLMVFMCGFVNLALFVCNPSTTFNFCFMFFKFFFLICFVTAPQVPSLLFSNLILSLFFLDLPVAILFLFPVVAPEDFFTLAFVDFPSLLLDGLGFGVEPFAVLVPPTPFVIGFKEGLGLADFGLVTGLGLGDGPGLGDAALFGLGVFLVVPATKFGPVIFFATFGLGVFLTFGLGVFLVFGLGVFLPLTFGLGVFLPLIFGLGVFLTFGLDVDLPPIFGLGVFLLTFGLEVFRPFVANSTSTFSCVCCCNFGLPFPGLGVLRLGNFGGGGVGLIIGLLPGLGVFLVVLTLPLPLSITSTDKLLTPLGLPLLLTDLGLDTAANGLILP